MKKQLCILALCFYTLPTIAQLFKGKVTDEAGVPIPYASLYLKELQAGFTTDDNGCFQTALKQGHYTCEISSLGYTGQTLTFQMPAGNLEKNVVLAERIYALREVSVVKGAEDPAYRVMRKAIANAPYYRTQVKSFTAGTYIKGTGKMKSIPAILKLSKEVRQESKKFLGKFFVMEEQREVTFKAPDKWDSRVKAYTNSFPEGISIGIGLNMVNFYEPTIFEKVSPLSAGAFSYYRFKLEGCYSEGNYLINKIKVIPKKDNQKLMKGDLYIVEDLWCVSAADISIRTSGLKAAIKVTCKEVQPSVFLATSTSMATTVDMMGFDLEASYLAAVHYTKVEVNDRLQKINRSTAPATSRLTKAQQKMKEQIEKLSSKEDLTLRDAYKLSKLMTKSIEEADSLKPKHKFELRQEASRSKAKTDSLAGEKDSLYWTAIRSVPLRAEEIQSYIHKKELPVPKDSLPNQKKGKQSVAGKVFKTFFWGNTYRTKDQKAWITLSGLPSYVPEYNFVDGFWIGAKVKTGMKLSESSTLHLIPSLYYATARKTWIGQGDLILDYAPRRRGQLALSGGVLSADYNGESGENRIINSFASSLFGRNDVKLYDKRFLSASHRIELANGLLFSTSLSWQQRKMLENHISQSWFKRRAESNIPDNETFRPMPDNELLKASFVVEYTPAHYYRMSRGEKIYDKSRYPTFSFRYDRAFPLNTTVLSPSYHLTEFSAKQNIEFGMFNSFVWSVNAGAFWNARQMQFPDYKHFAATSFPLTGRTFDSGFTLLDNYAFSTSTRWAQANVSWYTPYLLLMHLPFIRNLPLDEALHLRSLAVYGRRPYTEAGYSIGFSDQARVGVFAGFDCLKFRSVGVSVSVTF